MCILSALSSQNNTWCISKVNIYSGCRTPKCNPQSLATCWNPFSCGSGNCIGQTLALAEARTTLAVFVTQLQFDLPEGVNWDSFLKTEQES